MRTDKTKLAEEPRQDEEEKNIKSDSREMIPVPSGEFWRGCNETDTACEEGEKPGRWMSVSPFLLDRTEVTVAAYRHCVEAGGCTIPKGHHPSCNWNQFGHEQHPINCVSWEQAQAYCEWGGKRLPTEAEWEKAARGTDGRIYPWGDTWEQGKANIDGPGDGYKWTAPVGSCPAGISPYGALDMIGNGWEWTADWYEAEHKYRALHGGSWSNQPLQVRSSERYRNSPKIHAGAIGFRCTRSVG